MNFFKLHNGNLVNMDQVIKILTPTREYGEDDTRLVLSNGSIITLREDEWKELKPLVISYTFYVHNPTDFER